MKRASLAIATMALLALVHGQAIAQETASGPSPKVPELAALSGLIGQWDSKAEIQTLAGVNRGLIRKGTAKGEWIHGGHFLRQNWTLEPAGENPEISGFTIFGYDPTKKTYRSWKFSSEGSTSEGTGTFDEKTSTMTWTALDAGGLRTVTVSAFPEPGVENWSITVTSADGKSVATVKGKNIRRKG